MNRHLALRLLFQVLLGLVLCLVSGFLLLYFYAFSTLVDPALQGWERWRAILGNMFELPFPGSGTAFLLAMFVGGGFLVVHGLIRLVFGKTTSPAIGIYWLVVIIAVCSAFVACVIVLS